MHGRRLYQFCWAVFVGAFVCAAPGRAADIDLSRAVIVSSETQGAQVKVAEMLRDEIQRRTGLALSIVRELPAQDSAAIVLEVSANAPADRVPAKPESYAIWVEQGMPRAHLEGRDARGVLFAAGRLVRLLDMKAGSVTLNADTRISTAPDAPYRAHQLGYRDTANTYDAWDLATFEQYIRDLILFGTNGIELIPTPDPELYDGKVMTEKMWDMNAKLSALIGSYGLDVWLWAAVEDDVTTPDGAAAGLAKRKAMFASMPHVDHVFVPGGDDGSTPADILMPWLGELARVLHDVHPNATLWVSNQTFTHEENDYFFGFLQEIQPEWLDGVVYGPWTELGWEEMRERTPARYKIRRYPDITHTIRSQYAIPDWDPFLAHTVGREPVIAMPEMQAAIYLRYREISDGFGTYSDGAHDDLHKIIWSAYGWDPKTDIRALLQEYGKVFFSAGLEKEIATGLMMLQDNWAGPLLENPGIEHSLAHWKGIAERNPDLLARNWRLQMFLFRAYYDAYVKEKAAAETKLEADALATLARAREDGVEPAILAARSILARADNETPGAALRKRIEELGAMLLDSIGYQLSVKEPYKARNPERGAMLDWLDQPLNNRAWIEARLAEILVMTDQSKRLAALDEIVHWEDPGPGGFYDNLGDAAKQPHLVRAMSWEQDPGYVHTARVEFPNWLASSTAEPMRWSWLSQAHTLYGTPLTLRYEGLDPKAQYRLRVTYAGRYKPTMSLIADELYPLHGALPQPQPIRPLEFHIPREATKDGRLELQWNLISGRGCQVAEVWLLRASGDE